MTTATARRLTVGEMDEALGEAVRRRGPGYRDPWSLIPGANCRYWYRDGDGCEGRCQVGEALHILGFPVDERSVYPADDCACEPDDNGRVSHSCESEPIEESAEEFVVRLNIDADDEAVELTMRVQSWQDCGAPWGWALAAARAGHSLDTVVKDEAVDLSDVWVVRVRLMEQVRCGALPDLDGVVWR